MNSTQNQWRILVELSLYELTPSPSEIQPEPEQAHDPQVSAHPSCKPFLNLHWARILKPHVISCPTPSSSPPPAPHGLTVSPPPPSPASTPSFPNCASPLPPPHRPIRSGPSSAVNPYSLFHFSPSRRFGTWSPPLQPAGVPINLSPLTDFGVPCIP